MSEQETGFNSPSPYLLGKLEGRIEEQEKRIEREGKDFREDVKTLHERIDKKHSEVMGEFKSAGEAMSKLSEKQEGLQKWMYGLLLTGAIAIMTIELGIIKVIGESLVGE